MKYKKFILILLLIIIFPVYVDARRGCCSHHGGVSHCNTSIGMYVCNDGTVSPTCGCEYVAPATTKRKTTVSTTVRTTTNSAKPSTTNSIVSTTLTTTSTKSLSNTDSATSSIVNENASNNMNIKEANKKQDEEDLPGSVIIGAGIVGAASWYIAKKKKLI